jgi:hypothetical protein
MNVADGLCRSLIACGAWLIAVSMLTGIWTAAALTQKFGVGDGKLALAAHLNALIGGLWLIAVAWSLDYLCYSEKGRRRIAWLISLSVWANWLVTLIASFLKVNGLDYNNDPKNNAIAFLLQTTVVLPALAGAIAWALGFRKQNVP